jgi:hypothetical protein
LCLMDMIEVGLGVIQKWLLRHDQFLSGPLHHDVVLRSKSGWNPVCCFYFRHEGQGYMRSLFPLPTDAGSTDCRKAET